MHSLWTCNPFPSQAMFVLFFEADDLIKLALFIGLGVWLYNRWRRQRVLDCLRDCELARCYSRRAIAGSLKDS